MKGLKWLGIFGGVILLLVLASLGLRAIQERGIAGKLAKLRQMGRPTTMAELNAWYVTVPAESNAALGVLAAMEMFPTDAPAKMPMLGTGAAKVEGVTPWSDEARALARGYLSSNATAYAALEKALKLRASRYPVTFSYPASMPHLAQVKAVAQRLAVAAQLAAEEGKRDEATAAIVNVFRVARTLEPEPFLVSLMVRDACVAVGLSSTERIVNQLDLTGEQLARVQSEVADALGTNVLARSLAGERAYGLDGYAIGPAQIMAGAPPAAFTAAAAPRGETFGAALYTWSGLKAGDFQAYLDVTIRAEDAANQEYPQRLTTISNIAYEVSGGSNHWPFVKTMTRMVVPALENVVQRDAHNSAKVRCALAALAVERFRIAHDGKLPATLAELVPKYLAAVPTDPFDGKPLRFRPLVKGFVVYSLGEDGDDDGGRPRKVGQKVAGDFDVTFRIER